MIIHKIKQFIANAGPSPDGRPIMQHITACGREVFVLAIMPEGSKIALGAKPHAECAKCFPPVRGRSAAFDMPTGDIPEAPTTDEHGNVLGASRDTSMGTPIDVPRTHELRIKATTIQGIEQSVVHDDNGLGKLEGGDFG